MAFRTILATAFGLAITSAPAFAKDAAAADDAVVDGFQQSVGAVFDPGARTARILLFETEHGVQSSRTLWLGDAYRDGWRLVSVGDGEALLRRGQRTLHVGLTAGWEAEQRPAPVEVAVATLSSVSLTNGATATQTRQVAVARAIAAGEPGNVYRMNGSTREIAQAMARRVPQLNALVADRRVTFNVNIDSDGTSLIANRDGQQVGRFAAPQLNLVDSRLGDPAAPF